MYGVMVSLMGTYSELGDADFTEHYGPFRTREKADKFAQSVNNQKAENDEGAVCAVVFKLNKPLVREAIKQALRGCPSEKY